MFPATIKEEITRRRDNTNNIPTGIVSFASKPILRRESTEKLNQSQTSLRHSTSNIKKSTSNFPAPHMHFLPTSSRKDGSRPSSAKLPKETTFLKAGKSEADLLITSVKTKLDKRPHMLHKPSFKDSHQIHIKNPSNPALIKEPWSISTKSSTSSLLVPFPMQIERSDSLERVKEFLKNDSTKKLEELMENRNSPTPSKKIVEYKDFNSTFDLAFDVQVEEPLVSKFFTTLPLQTHIYNLVHIPPDEPSSQTLVSSTFKHKTHQLYKVETPILNLERLKSVVAGLMEELSILRTRIYRNDKILDADVEGFVDPSKKFNFDFIIQTIKTPSNLNYITSSDLSSYVKNWLYSNNHINPAFKIGVMESKQVSEDGPLVSLLLFSWTMACADSMTLTCIVQNVLERYIGSGERIRNFSAHDEYYAFDDFAKKISLDASVSKHKALDFWKNQCFELFETQISDSKKSELENQMAKLSAEHERLKKQIVVIKQQREEVEKGLLALKTQRIDLERGSKGPQSTFMDPITFEQIQIPESIRSLIINKVFGSSAEDITPFLDKNGINAGLRNRAGEEYFSMVGFCTLTEANMIYLTNDEKFKLLKLSEITRNQVKDALHDQKAFKYEVERKIAKWERELKHLLTNLYTIQKQFDTGDDQRIKYSQILNPPIISNKIGGIKIEKNAFGNSTVGEDYTETYEDIEFTIEEDCVTKLRQFQNYLSSLEGKTPAEQNSSFEDLSGVSEIYQTPSVNAVCLTAFGVVLKHITGVDKFLVGVRQDYRKDSLLGPLSDTVPIKIDFSEKEKTLNSIVLKLWSSMKEGVENGIVCPSNTIYSTLHVERPSICFEFIGFSTVEKLSSMGVSVDQILETNGVENVSGTKKLWSINEMEPYELKITIIDVDTELKCKISYKKDIYSLEKVQQWVEKFENTLWQIEYGTRKLTIPNIISRLYNRVWHGSSSSFNVSLENVRQ